MIAETVCSAASAAGVGIAAVTAYRKRFLAATRILAYALVPVALVMTGLVKWLAHTPFSPVAWAGFVLLGLAWLLFMITRTVERRTGGTRKERRAAARAARGDGQEQGRAAPALGASGGPAAQVTAAAQPRGTARKGTAGDTAEQKKPAEDFSDIEAILKKHGI